MRKRWGGWRSSRTLTYQWRHPGSMCAAIAARSAAARCERRFLERLRGNLAVLEGAAWTRCGSGLVRNCRYGGRRGTASRCATHDVLVQPGYFYDFENPKYMVLESAYCFRVFRGRGRTTSTRVKPFLSDGASSYRGHEIESVFGDYHRARAMIAGLADFERNVEEDGFYLAVVSRGRF